MLNEPVKANNLDLQVFSNEQYDGDLDEWQLAVNSWLKGQPDNIVVHDIIYRHCGRTTRGKDIISVAILSSPAARGH